MPTMNVSLTAEMAEYVEAELKAGDYVSASEVVRDALRILRHERAVEREKLNALRREIDIGLDDVESGAFSNRTVEEIARAVLRGDE